MSATSDSIFSRIRALFRKHPIIANFIYIVGAAVILAYASMIFLNVWTEHGHNAVVPQVKHLTYADAERVLWDAGLKIEISDSIYERSVAPGTVIESWPKAGSVVKAGREVYVTVNAFSPKTVALTMPVTGVSLRQAMSYLEALGITAIRVVNVPSQFPDLVEAAECDGRPIGVGSHISVASSVTLSVGTAIEPTYESEADSVAAVSAYENYVPDISSYEFDDEDL